MNDKLQNMYRINLIAAFVVCGSLLVFFALYSLSLVQVDSRFGLLVSLVIMIIFLPINLFMQSRNKNHRLRVPNRMHPKVLKALAILAFIIFAIVLAYGFLVYPRAPIQSNGEFFTDKSGAIYSFAEFRTFQKWEAAYITSWNIFALSSIVLLPFYDNTSKKWRL